MVWRKWKCVYSALGAENSSDEYEGGVRPNGLPYMQLFDLVVHTVPKEALFQMWTRLGLVSDPSCLAAFSYFLEMFCLAS